MAAPLRLCYITDRRALAPQPLLARIAAAARAGVDLVQVREKDLPTRELLDLTRAALECAHHSAVRVVVNDRLDVALALGAAGVHLTTTSIPARVVRGVCPGNFLVGVSCHSLEEAIEAESSAADYILLGPIFPTPSKLPYGPPLGLGKLGEVTKRVKIPVLALGGITVERVKECLAAGASGIAGISIFQNCSSLEELVHTLLTQFSPPPSQT
jgi:thiamine-phosphate pyrophosphorylase